ncbi:MAG: 2TM domain-containing protein [Bacteroidota bacterium]|nr:2TM domain-containing protein [Bacteroidota bacterium]
MENFESEKEKELWKLAKKRVGFKRHLAIYLIINTLFWLMWLFEMKEDNENNAGIPWPLFCTLGWGIGISFSFLGAYVFPKNNSIEKEFQKLKNK